MFVTFLLVATVVAQPADEVDLSASRERCLELMCSRDYPAVVREIKALPKEIRDDMFIQLVLGRALIQLDLPQEAFAALRPLATDEQTPAMVHLLLGQCALKTSQYQDAWKSFDRYTQLGPEEEDLPGRVALLIRVHVGDPKGAGELVRDTGVRHQVTPQCMLWNALLLSMAGEDTAAEAAATDFLKVDPTNVRGLFFRAKLRSRQGDDDGAVNDVRAMLTVDPKLAGGFDVMRVRQALREPGDIAYGRKQVEAVLRDRPAMGKEFDVRNPLHVWVALRFQHRVGDATIQWSADFQRDDPQDVANAYNLRVPETNYFSVHLSTADSHGTPLPRDQLWESLLFELENVSRRDRDAVYAKAALLGTISRKDFVLATTGLESKAEHRTRAFFVEVYYPWCKENGIEVSSADWIDYHLTAEDCISAHPPDDYYPWTIYGRQYDALRLAGARWLESLTDGK